MSASLLMPGRKPLFFQRRRIIAHDPSALKIYFSSAVTDIGSVSSRECLDAPAIFATFTAGRTGLVIVWTDQSETSPLKFALQNALHNLAGFRLSLEISHF